MIKKLSLTNFRKHEKLELDFTAGLNGIFGPNYRGKSTVLYGILFALGGIRAIPCSTVVREGVTTYKVDLTFESGETYRVIRTKSTDRLYLGETDAEENLIANGTSVVNKKIEEIIGMTMKRFVQTRYARQKKTDAILLSGANELYAIINEISGADTVEAALKVLGEKVKGLDGFLDRVEMPDVKAMEDELESVIHCLEEKAKEMLLWTDMSTQHKTDLEAARTQLNTLRETEKLYNTYESNLRHAQEDLRKASQEVENAVSRAAVVDETLPEKETQLKNYIETLTATMSEISGINMLLAQHRKDFAGIESQLLDAKLKIESLEPAVDPEIDEEVLAEQRTLLAEHTANLANANRELKQLESEVLEPNCKTCGRAWADHEEKKLHHDTAVRTVTGTKTLLQKQVLELQEIVNQSSAKLENYRAIKNDYDNAFSATQQLILGFETRKAQTLESIQQNETKLKTVCPEGSDSLPFQRADCEGQLTEVQKLLRRAEQDRQDVERAKTREAEAQTKLQSVLDTERPEFLAGDLDKAISIERALSDSYTQASTALSNVSAQHTELTGRRARLTTDIPAVQEQANKITTAEGQRSVNKNLTKFLKSNRDRYMADIWTVLMAQASQFVRQCTSDAIESIARTDDGDFVYTENERTLAISEASGAQLSIMGLAMQLALSSAVQPPLDVLLVDEPNADMDPEHSMAVNLLLSATVGQVICVSHSHMDSSVCENVIEL
jgi:DNA repair exonuclease SbcCD ATPase subunit